MLSLLQRLTARLCLVAALLTGLTPVHGFVLCLEPDGRVSVDLVAPAEHCGCCEVQVQDSKSAAQPLRTLSDTDCGCVDVALSGSAQCRWNQPRPVGPEIGPELASSPKAVVPVLVTVAAPARVAPSVVPRPPDTLVLIRSVLLLL